MACFSAGTHQRNCGGISRSRRLFWRSGTAKREREPQLRPLLERIVNYRRHVLAIFENLVCHDSATQKLQ